MKSPDIIYIRECRQILGKIRESVGNRKKESTPAPKRRSTGRRRIEGALRSTKRRKRRKRSINQRVDRTIINKSAERKTRRE
jgi:hypothetical protein